ncbi:MFS transporter [Flexivirga endophytica]|uniref:MFS transporter n=1 Tax=Flexivirga endophytica TaxID=1849103 RepID=A0A916WYG7_9MICO|nr:MFS transporter [Flexivirga endophytica]GGB42245.1 MFS transporter [Flexivirga endophytica]GHB70440.1 MFS transporter [Flexivirga endophytica]
MSFNPYQRVLSISDARRVLFLGLLLRIPIASAAVVLTLHVVQSLSRSYSEAGLVAAGATLAIAVSGPWRGKLLDRLGLRRVVLPSLLVNAVCWSIAPFVGYWPLLVLATVAGLFVVPTFSIIRQGVIAAVPDSERRTALSLDSVTVEMAFMVGPAVAVWLATAFDTRFVLCGLELAGVVAGIALYLMNPPLRGADPETDKAGQVVPRRAWFRAGFLAICGAAAACTIVLGGSDVAIVAAMREFDAVSQMSIVLVPWAAGSLFGGLIYGALSRSFPPFLLLLGLAVATAPMAFAGGTWSLAAISLIAGLFCAPTITATVDAVSRVVPSAARGEAMGWHGSFMTAGGALGAPLAGAAIDTGGFGAGFLLVAGIGAAVAVTGFGALVLHRRHVVQHALAA